MKQVNEADQITLSPIVKPKKPKKVTKPAPQTPVVLDQRSLINLCLDLLELDPDAPENQELIAQRLQQLGQKVDNYAAMDSFADSQVDMLIKEKKHIESQIARLNSVRENLRARALYVMKTMNVKSLKNDTGHSLAIRVSEKVEITNVSELPDWAITTTTTVAPNKIRIKDAIKDNQPVSGARIALSEYVVIK